MLSVRNLTIGDEPDGLRQISFEVGNGEVVGVVGPNGSGKSLLLRTVADPDSTHRGEVVINHLTNRSEPLLAQAQLGYVGAFDEISLALTGFEYLELVGSFYHLSSDQRGERIVTLAQTFQCERELYSVIEQQSRAIRQKIILMASIIADPAVIVWDEPTQFLDSFGREIVENVIKTSLDRQASMLVASNDLNFIEQVASRIIILSHGRVIASGTIGELSRLAGGGKKLLREIVKQLTRHA